MCPAGVGASAVRVVGGEWRGRPLAAPAGRGTRPTSDKVREAIFDVLGALAGRRVEERCRAAASACSRAQRRPRPVRGQRRAGHRGPVAGRRHLHLRRAATARRCARCATTSARLGLEATARPSGGEARCRVLAADVRRALQADARRAARYTLVFADPPYDRYAELRAGARASAGSAARPARGARRRDRRSDGRRPALAGRARQALRRHTGHVSGRRWPGTHRRSGARR